MRAGSSDSRTCGRQLFGTIPRRVSTTYSVLKSLFNKHLVGLLNPSPQHSNCDCLARGSPEMNFLSFPPSSYAMSPILPILLWKTNHEFFFPQCLPFRFGSTRFFQFQTTHCVFSGELFWGPLPSFKSLFSFGRRDKLIPGGVFLSLFSW